MRSRGGVSTWRPRLVGAALAVLAVVASAYVTAPPVRADGPAAPPPPRPFRQTRAVVVKLDPVVYDAHGMRPELKQAVTKVQAAAKREGMTVEVTSGYRSSAEQARLFRDEVARTGSEEAASKTVAPVWQTHHTQGIAVDLGPNDTVRAWIEKHQDEFGLCRRYANETWHFELNLWGTCPALLPTAAEDMG